MSKQDRIDYNKKVANKLVELCEKYDLRIMQLIENLNKGVSAFYEEPLCTYEKLVDYENAINAYNYSQNGCAVKKDKETTMYNHKQSKSYLHKKYLKDMKRSIVAIKNDVESVLLKDLQGKYMLLLNVVIDKHFAVVLGKVTNTIIRKYNNADNKERITLRNKDGEQGYFTVDVLLSDVMVLENGIRKEKNICVQWSNVSHAKYLTKDAMEKLLDRTRNYLSQQFQDIQDKLAE